MYDFNNEEKFFNFLSDYCSEKKNINIDEEFIPNEFNLKNVQINYLDQESWFFRFKKSNN